MEKKAVDSNPLGNWMNVARAAQAACAANGGIGVVELRVIVIGNEPIIWHEPALDKLHPKSAAKLRMTPEIAQVLLAALTKEE